MERYEFGHKHKDDDEAIGGPLISYFTTRIENFGVEYYKYSNKIYKIALHEGLYMYN